MVAHKFPRAPLSGRRQSNAPVFLIHNKGWPLRGEPLKHPGHGRRPHSEPIGKDFRRDPHFLGAAQLEDRFEVIVDGFRIRERNGFSCHYP